MPSGRASSFSLRSSASRESGEATEDGLYWLLKRRILGEAVPLYGGRSTAEMWIELVGGHEPACLSDDGAKRAGI